MHERFSHLLDRLLKSSVTALNLSWGSFLLAVLLVFHCITITTAACPTPGGVPAVTNSRTTLLKGYGSSSEIITTLAIDTCMDVSCRVADFFVYDDPWWLYVYVPELGIYGWVADYYADCGYVGSCQVPTCS